MSRPRLAAPRLAARRFRRPPRRAGGSARAAAAGGGGWRQRRGENAVVFPIRQLEVRWDDDVPLLPTDRTVWLWGWDNRWRSQFVAALAGYEITVSEEGVQIDKTALRRAEHTVVLTARHPGQAQHTLAWMATDNAAALPGLGRKLPHYGKYSYLGFTGDEPVNVVKGQWSVVDSPMSVLLLQADGSTVSVAQAALAPRPALAALPPVSSAERMQH